MTVYKRNVIGMTLSKVGVLVGTLASAQAAVGGQLIAKEDVIGEDGYNKTYTDDSKSFGQRMKEAKETPVAKFENEKGGFGVSGFAALGSVYNAEPTSSTGAGWSLGAEPSFVVQGDSWSRYEFGVQVAASYFQWKVKSAEHTIKPISLMPRFGWGYSLGSNLMGVVKFGYGLSQSSMDVKDSGMMTKYDTVTGSVMAADYEVIYGDGFLQFFGGLGVTQHKYSWSKYKVESVTGEADQVDCLNFVNVKGGLRAQF